jgi:cytidylate kinase
LKIAISGKSGCGNTTVSRLVAGKLGYRFINFTFRSLAEENKITLQEVLRNAAVDDSWDREVDRRQIALALESEGGCVLGSRLAIWMLKDAALKVYLHADSKTRAERIMQREGGSFTQVNAFTEERDRQDSERYRRLFGIDNNDFSIADLVINTEKFKPEQVADILIAALPRLD